ncbi:MAG: hypothetical protein KDD22_08665 [Bdellovibrionales bacterium]|nr:hypothetical protein [Bdellovibrionales bacterium]
MNYISKSLLTSFFFVASTTFAVGCSSKSQNGGGQKSSDNHQQELKKVEHLPSQEVIEVLNMSEGEGLGGGEVLLEKSEIAPGLYQLILDARKILLSRDGDYISLEPQDGFSWEKSDTGWKVVVEGEEYLLTF